jgi:type III pantothenate kinase
MTRCLLLDIGNSRVKWAIASGDRLSRQQAVAHGGRLGGVLRGPLAKAMDGVDSVCCVSVAAPAMTVTLLRQLRRRGLPARRLQSRREQLGLRNGYREAWRLGADRWAAMLGARALGLGRRSLLVVGAGTALTVDLVDPAGRHLGGVIVPGRRLMAAALLADTAGIARRARGLPRPGGRSAVFATDTREALQSGADQAAAALVERLRVEARRKLGHYPQVVLTGGDGPALARKLKCRFKLVPDLVLRGLAATL